MAASQSRRFNLIRDVDNTKETWRLKVQVIRLYSVPSWLNPKETNRIEMIFCDEKKDKIQASFGEKMVKTFRPLIYEGELYTISNFSVTENKDNLKACKNKWKINFHKNTSIRDCSTVEIPKYPFEIISFEDIFDQIPTTNVFIDIIGVLKGKSAVDIVGEERKQTKKMKIKLENECGRTLEVLLWGDYVELLNHYVETHPGRITVILQFVKLKYFNGLPFVSNSFYTSRLLLNWKCEALTCFLASIGNLDDNNTTLEDLNVKRALSINDDFSQCTNRKYISDFLEIKEVKYVN
ncbi:hypothetical protein KSS87_000977 [Heliosperma pusillum]|nr:hypothetical protein KSS87_000977 [Heliosperma pusillum]